ncbi:MAG: 3-oxoacyl-ACP reductase family protein [bacterium]
MKLQDRVVLITGASRGIGRAIALMFAREGAKIILDYHVSDYEPDAENNVKDVSRVINEMGGECISIEADISQEDIVKMLVSKGIEKFGRIDVLVNNAGIVFDLPISERTIEQWQRTINTNLMGCYMCSKYASESMMDNKFGKIINISSTNAINCFNPDSLDYDASKAGIITLTKNFAKALFPYVNVNAIAPGWVDTEMNKDLPQEFVNDEASKIYLNRFAQPEEIANVALFLASEDARYVNGSVIIVDGGHD